jgi:hypothetical protein
MPPTAQVIAFGSNTDAKYAQKPKTEHASTPNQITLAITNLKLNPPTQRVKLPFMAAPRDLGVSNKLAWFC